MIRAPGKYRCEGCLGKTLAFVAFRIHQAAPFYPELGMEKLSLFGMSECENIFEEPGTLYSWQLMRPQNPDYKFAMTTFVAS